MRQTIAKEIYLAQLQREANIPAKLPR